MSREGFTGERGVDGFVEWRVEDGTVSLACGSFLILASRVEDVGGASAVSFATGDELAEEMFPWSLDGFIEAAATIAEYLEHPAPDNVEEAAREVWFARLQEAV